MSITFTFGVPKAFFNFLGFTDRTDRSIYSWAMDDEHWFIRLTRVICHGSVECPSMRMKPAPSGKYALAKQMRLQDESFAEMLVLEEIKI